MFYEHLSTLDDHQMWPQIDLITLEPHYVKFLFYELAPQSNCDFLVFEK